MGLFKTKLERLEAKAKRLEDLQEEKTLKVKLKIKKEKEAKEKNKLLGTEEQILNLRISKAKKLGLNEEEIKYLKEKKDKAKKKREEFKKKTKKTLNNIGKTISSVVESMDKTKTQMQRTSKNIEKNRRYRKYMLKGLSLSKLNDLNKIFNQSKGQTKIKAYDNIYKSNIGSKRIRNAILGQNMKKSVKSFNNFK